MENYNNPNESNFNSQPQQPQQPQQSSVPPMPPMPSTPIPPVSEPQPENSAPPMNGDEGGSRWFGTLVFVIVVALILYYVGFWGWLKDSFSATPVTDDENTEEVEDLENATSTDEAVNNGQTNNGGSTDNQAAVEAGKGRVSFVLSAGLRDGFVLASGQNDNLEVRRVSVHNPYKDSWVLIYDGIRPLDLKQLAASKEKHELITVDLLAMDYDQVRLEFVDLFSVNGDEKVRRERTADLGGIKVTEDGEMTVNIWFDIKDEFRPEPELESRI